MTVHDYDKYIVAFSGGKDSIACLLHLLDLGVPKEKIELWHHEVDAPAQTFMDWECTHSYCKKFAEAFGIEIYFSWKYGGFRGEMLRENQTTGKIYFEVPSENDLITKAFGKDLMCSGGNGPLGTRRKFPQVSADLRTRWCSSYLKIDVCSAAIVNQPRFKGIRTLVISGERALESAARSKYLKFDADRTDSKKRYVDRWRPVLWWSEQEVWEIIEKYRVMAHPAYYLGWGRVSCKFCIFGNKDQFASAYKISRHIGEELISYEKEFGCTIKRNISLRDLINQGVPYEMADEMIKIATSHYYTLPIIADNWTLPKGAYGDGCGPV